MIIMASYRSNRWLIPVVAGAFALSAACEKNRDDYRTVSQATGHIIIDPYVADSVRQHAKNDALFLDGTAYVREGHADSIRISVLDVNLQPDSTAMRKYEHFVKEAAKKACDGKPDGEYDFHFGANSVLDHEKKVSRNQ